MEINLLIEADDTALVASIAERHEPALGEAYRRHSSSVHGLARRLLGDGALAEDVTQEIFVRLWRQPERFDATRGKLRTMLLTQAHGLAVDMIRRERARARREDRVHHEPKAPPPDVDAELITMIDVEQIRSALETLDEHERTAIQLAFYGGHTYRQVAEILDVPEGTIKTRIRTGLRRLQQRLPADAGAAQTRRSDSTTAPPTGAAPSTNPTQPNPPQPAVRNDQPWTA